MFEVDTDECTGCGACAEVCPQKAIGIVGGKAEINKWLCIECGSCSLVCPVGAIREAVRSRQAAFNHERFVLGKKVSEMPFGRGSFGRGGRGFGMGYGRGMGMGRGCGYGMGSGRGMGMGRGNPYPFCCLNPSLPRRWWAYGGGYQPLAPWPGYDSDPYYPGPAPQRPWW